jgi:hypothetical protein
MMFFQHIGGERDSEYPDMALSFPQTNLPDSWVSYAESGVIRLEVYTWMRFSNSM